MNSPLSARELECINWLSKGDQPKQVAHRMGITLNTMRTYIRTARNKTQSHTAAALVATAIREKWIQ